MNLRRNILGIVALTSLSATYAQTGKEWDNPAITSVNREVSHTVALPMASEADVQQNDPKLSPYYQSLDGVWKFYWVNTPTKATAAMCAKDYDDGSWTDIDVPSSWLWPILSHSTRPPIVSWPVVLTASSTTAACPIL